MILTRNKINEYGVFGELTQDDGTHIAYTLEHNFDGQPKVAAGTYTCVRGEHRLNGMTDDFTTFEITGVSDFQGRHVSGILFHWGNYNKDSEGCVLLGTGVTDTMVTNSRSAFENFMTKVLPLDCQSFTITIS